MSRRLPLAAVAIVIPLVLSGAGVAVASMLLSGIPHPIAVHWGIDGGADGFAPAWTVVIGMAVLGLLFPLGLGLVLMTSRPPADAPAPWQKLVAVIGLGMAVLNVVLGLWILLSQREPSGGAPTVWPGLIGAFGGAAAAAAIAWFLLPRGVVPEPVLARPAQPLRLSADERASWIASTRLSRVALVVVAVGILLAMAAVTVAIAATDGRAWPLLFVPFVLVVLLLATSSWTVRVDADGLTVRSMVGWPAFRIRPGEIAEAGVTEIAPLAEFGGWGLRWGARRRFGIVMRGGEGLEVRRRDGRALVVTVDDAATAAGLLAAIAAR